MYWTEFQERQRTHAAAALGAARALLTGDPEPASARIAGLLSQGDPVFARRVLTQLRVTPPAPRPGVVLGALYAEIAPGSSPPEEAEEFLLRQWAAEHGAPGAVTETQRLAWAIDELRFLGEETARREREAWALDAAGAESDDEARLDWQLWFGGGSGHVQALARWIGRYRSRIERPFRQVAARGGHPTAPRGSALSRAIEDALLTQMTVGQDGIPGWLDVAVRVLESGEGGALHALAGRLDEGSRQRTASCVARRRNLASTATWLWPELPPSWRVEHLDRLLRDPATLDGFGGAHAARHLIGAWARGSATLPDAAWSVARACRRRHRLRAAVASGQRARLGEALLSLDHLGARTARALSRYAFDWAWEELHHDFAFGGRALTPACPDTSTRPRPVIGRPTPRPRQHDPRQRALGTWVLKVVLRGRLPTLRAWLRPDAPRKTGDELRELLNELPERCRHRRGAPWDAVRAALWSELDSYLSDLRPTLVELAAVDLERPAGRVRDEVRALLARPGLWDPCIPPIGGAYARCVPNARAALQGGSADVVLP